MKDPLSNHAFILIQLFRRLTSSTYPSTASVEITCHVCLMRWNSIEWDGRDALKRRYEFRPNFQTLSTVRLWRVNLGVQGAKSLADVLKSNRVMNDIFDYFCTISIILFRQSPDLNYAATSSALKAQKSWSRHSNSIKWDGDIVSHNGCVSMILHI